MKKMWAWILMTILMIGMLPGCSQEGGESSVSDAETESAVEQVQGRGGSGGYAVSADLPVSDQCGYGRVRRE